MTKLTPKYPRIIKDRDQYRRWYLDQATTVTLSNGDKLRIPKGYRFDAHSVPLIFRVFFGKTYQAGEEINSKNDIYASMVHDFMIDVEMFLRYNRAYQDATYKDIMRNPDYSLNKYRSSLMPFAVSTYGHLRYGLWGDYRGEPKKETFIHIKTNES